MRIAQVAPLYESVPPKLYGGTERVVSYLTEELVRKGHDVTLFASGDSVTKARLHAPRPLSIRLDKNAVDGLAGHVLMLEQVFQQAKRFDVVHFHIDYLHFPLSRRLLSAQLTTLHGRLDLSELAALYDEYRDMPVVSISDAQREPLSQARWLGTVRHGLPRDLYRYRAEPEGYFAYLGRICPEKQPDHAIRIAKRCGVKIKLAAKVDQADRVYFRDVIEPMLGHPLVEFVGEIDEARKSGFLGGARALLFPIGWPEPFGLAMIEALACGTPVIAYRRGSVPEVIQDGVTGFIVDDEDGAVRAAGRLDELSRARCRAVFEARFGVERMASDYLALYEKAARAFRSPAAAAR